MHQFSGLIKSLNFRTDQSTYHKELDKWDGNPNRSPMNKLNASPFLPTCFGACSSHPKPPLEASYKLPRRKPRFQQQRSLVSQAFQITFQQIV